MRKTVGVALLVLAIGWTHSAMAGGIPVIDVSNLNQQLLQVQHMVSQIEQLKHQLETARRELDSISGSRGLANLIDSAYDTTVEVSVDDVLTAAGLKNGSQHGLSGSAADLYDSGNSYAATWLAQSEKSLAQAQERFSDLTGLVAKVNASPDQKDILDLQARIGAEEVMLQNEFAKLTMLRSQAEANQAIHVQQVQQMSIESSGELREVSW
ncbi:hypothetical protein GCM10011348_28380 [Marinobacterium nitratireducens]|uniref:Type IV secretion system protein VirB5 n=1 Tax=Marinobacterium nitratireducens TaxID=518897 RepID=A0A918DTZ7_9GAMM|nr:type IV secretion system protein [Marinobacterium nitratireducens]GGO83787.1 hypothetical protein GCM10011348_28380 [Marinobacterium nitratireducens]